jgi:hypothetical protein
METVMSKNGLPPVHPAENSLGNPPPREVKIDKALPSRQDKNICHEL